MPVRLKSFYKYFIVIVCIISFCQILSFFCYHRNNSFNISNAPHTSICLDWDILMNEFNESGGMDIAIDSENNVFVLGYFYNNSKGAYDRILVKYDNNGKILWNRTFDYDAVGINALGIDSSDNIFIVGDYYNTSNDTTDILVNKYNSSGNLEWEEIWSGPEWDCAYGVCFDDMNNIYVVGNTESFDIFGDAVVLKYNSSGYLKWNKTWGGSDTDFAFDIQIDHEENLYFTGYTSSFGIETANTFLVKFNSSGHFLWNKTWGTSLVSIGTSLTIDSSNNIFITGYTQSTSGLSHDIFTYKINGSGMLQWSYTYGGPGHHLSYSIALDSKENIFIAGVSNKDVVLIKLNQTGNKLWIKTWGDELEEIAYSIALDTDDNVFITGYQQTIDGHEYLFLLKFLPTPDNFELSSDASTHDPDGNFTISWTESLDADNYTLFQSDNLILELNSSVIEVAEENTNRTYSFENFPEGIYYFMVVAFNEYGNTSSNCIRVKVQFPPGEFTLNNHTDIPDTDGIVNLTWSYSEGVKNYSVFVSEGIIYDVMSNGTLVVENITEEFYLTEELTNGDYYYVVIAYNEAGETMSNCIHVAVRRTPERFNLTSDARVPKDDDGSFELIWTHSEYALNYTIYISNYSISVLNDSVTEIYNFTPSFEWPTYRYQLCHCSGTGLSNGTYYFIVVASNEYGTYTTECLEIIEKIPVEQVDEAHKNGNELLQYIPQVIAYVALGSLLTGLIFIYNKRRKS